MKKVAVVGAGIFGITTAVELAKNYQVDLYESNSEILQSASGINQFRIHRGYHYPRSSETVASSLASEESFRQMYKDVVIDSNEHYYAIANNNSLTTGERFIQFCKEHQLDYQETTLDILHQEKIECTVKVKESLIDPHKLFKKCQNLISQNNINLILNTKASKKILPQYDYVIIATYASINELIDDYPASQQMYQYELCEKIVCKLPNSYKNKSVVVLDGPFMCVDPYGETGNFLLGNVVHAIHRTNVDIMPKIPSKFKPLLNRGIIKNPPITRFQEIIESGNEFLKNFKKAKHIGSMFTYRSVQANKEDTDERLTQVKCVSDNIYIVYSGKIVSCVSAAKEVAQILASK